jgi:hypothetical protein
MVVYNGAGYDWSIRTENPIGDRLPTGIFAETGVTFCEKGSIRNYGSNSNLQIYNGNKLAWSPTSVSNKFAKLAPEQGSVLYLQTVAKYIGTALYGLEVWNALAHMNDAPERTILDFSVSTLSFGLGGWAGLGVNFDYYMFRSEFVDKPQPGIGFQNGNRSGVFNSESTSTFNPFINKK